MFRRSAVAAQLRRRCRCSSVVVAARLRRRRSRVAPSLSPPSSVVVSAQLRPLLRPTPSTSPSIGLFICPPPHSLEVNRIRELPQNARIVATHTDSPYVLIWDVEAQPNRHAVLGILFIHHRSRGQFELRQYTILHQCLSLSLDACDAFRSEPRTAKNVGEHSDLNVRQIETSGEKSVSKSYVGAILTSSERTAAASAALVFHSNDM